MPVVAGGVLVVAAGGVVEAVWVSLRPRPNATRITTTTAIAPTIQAQDEPDSEP
jgi:hypothetical protein